MQPLLLFFASVLSVQAALQDNFNTAAPAASPAPAANANANANSAQLQSLQATISAQYNQFMSTATGPINPSIIDERRSHIAAFMATQTNSDLAAAYASAQATRTSISAYMKTASPSDKAKAKTGFSQKMKDFFKKMQTKAQKNKETTSSVSSDAAQSTASQL
jgi:hypothetical protein